MCGFAGILSKDGTSNRYPHRLKKSCDLIAHRGPDDESYYHSKELSLGFRRLKIIDLSDEGRQPFTNDRYKLVFNGEIYNYVELREELRSLGYRFNTSSDTEVLFHGLAEWDTQCFSKLNGMFAIAWWDVPNKRLVLARDRFGEKPLFYSRNSDGLIFGSEIKALCPLMEHEPQQNPDAIYSYLLDGSLDTGEQTFIAGVNSVRPAHYLEVYPNKEIMTEYWSINARENSSDSPAEEFRALFLDSLKIRSRSDVPVGTCLSGGLDSSSIVCGLSFLEDKAAIKPTSKKTFSAVYGEYDESPQIKATTKLASAQSYITRPEPQSLDDLAKLIEFHDEPFHSFAAYASYQVMREAKRNNVIVVLNGQGADEILAGYYSFARFCLADSIKRNGYLKSFQLAKSFSSGTGKSTGNLMYGAVRERWKSVSDPFTHRLKKNREKPYTYDLITEALISDSVNLPGPNNYEGVGSLKSQMLSSAFHRALPLYLRVEDRNSMANSIESRLPFLDHRIAEFSFRQDPLVMMAAGANKSMLRHGLGNLLPREVINRSEKYGFPVPQSAWLFDHLKDEINDLLTRPSIDKIYHVSKLRKAYQQEVANRHSERPSRSNQWFHIISVALWLKHLSKLQNIFRTRDNHSTQIQNNQVMAGSIE